MPEKLCPCGSQKELVACCAPFLDGARLAPDPLTLMRSRYTAFCLNRIDYLRKTWHPETCPDDLGTDEPSNWIGLEIIDWSVEGDEGEVEFKARLIFDNKLETLHETSHFDKIDGVWLYHSGEFENEGQEAVKIPKSQPCPCGSGKLFKNCHMES